MGFVRRAPTAIHLFQLLVIEILHLNVFLHGRQKILSPSLVKMLRILDRLHHHEVSLKAEH